jgi:hypothetical protein
VSGGDASALEEESMAELKAMIAAQLPRNYRNEKPERK